jgi:hypothetical protein
MTTHAGRGANTAFEDALLLSETILGNQLRLYTCGGGMAPTVVLHAMVAVPHLC